MDDDDQFDPHVMEDNIDDFWNSNGIDNNVEEFRKGGEKFYLPRPPISVKDSLNWDELYSNIVYDVWARFKSMQNFHVRNVLGLDPLNPWIEKLSKKDEDIGYLNALTDEKSSEIFSEIEDRSFEFIEKTSEDLHNLGLWMPSEFGYKTTSGEFVDSIWSTFIELIDEDLLVKKEKPVKWCPDCRRALSTSEIYVKQKMNERVFVKVPLASGKKRFFLLDIDDMWMFPSCLTIAVNSNMKYAVVKIESEEKGTEQLVMLERNVESIIEEAEIEKYEILNTINGEDIEGLSFRYPLEDKIPEKNDIEGENVRKVILTDELKHGKTGFVFLVPEYKEEHWEIADEHDLETYNPILKNGYFDGGPRKNKYSGLSAREIESVIIDDLKSKNLIFTEKKIEKTFEMCDVCRTRLIRYPVRGWFLESQNIEDKFNKKIEKIEVLPSSDHLVIKDWLLSRDDLWGLPLPRWECTCGNTFMPSDRAELADMSDYEVSHEIRPDMIMNSSVICTECGDEMKCEKNTLDLLFVQACSPWAQLNYPHQEERSWWPGKIFLGRISQDVDLLVANLILSTVLFDEPSIEKIIFLGPVYSEIKHMNVEDLVSKNGYDSLRLHLLSDEPPWVQRKISRGDLKFSHRLPRVVWNLNKFLDENIDELELDLDDVDLRSLEEELGIEERWILSKLENAKKEIIDHYERGRFDLVVEALEEFILEDLAQSYIKRGRIRPDEESKEERLGVIKTLHLILDSLSKLLSPVSPFTAEKIYQSLNGDKQSVFMVDWPESDDIYVDQELESMMDDVKEIVDEILNVKRRSELPEKWPLRKIVYKARNQRGMDIIKKFGDFIKDKAIVREIEVLEPEEEWEEVVLKVESNRDIIADSYKHWVTKIETLLKQKSSEKIKEGIEKGGFEIGLEGRIIEIDPEMVTIKREMPDGFREISLEDQEIFVDLEVIVEIWEEEMVREVVLRLKSMRQDLDLDKEDEIEVFLDGDEDVIEAIKPKRSLIEKETGARSILLKEREMEQAQYVLEWDINGERVDIGIIPLYRNKMINFFTSIPGVDVETAELLYESGYSSVDSIKGLKPFQISNLKGIDSDLAEEIVHHIEESDVEAIIEGMKEDSEEIDKAEDEKVTEEKEEEKVEEEEDVSKELPEEIFKSSTYLIEEGTSDRSFKLLKNILETGETGLCVTRDYPEKVKTRYDLEDIEMIWLSNIDREDVIRPKSLEKLSLALENFLARTGGVILFKGLEYLITNNDFRTVLNLVQSIKDQVAINESILLITVNPEIIEKYQLDQISGVVDRTLKD